MIEDSYMNEDGSEDKLKKVIVNEPITRHVYLVPVFEDEPVSKFVARVASKNGLRNSNNLKVVIGGQNINCDRYMSHKMSFFLVENRPFYVSAVINITIFNSKTNKQSKIVYVVGNKVVSSKVYEFKDGRPFNFNNKADQFKIIKEGFLVERDVPIKPLSRGGFGTKGRGRGSYMTKGGGGGGQRSYNDFDSVPTLEEVNNQSNTQQGDFFNFSNTQQTNDTFNFSRNNQNNVVLNPQPIQMVKSMGFVDGNNNQNISLDSPQRKKGVQFIDVENSRTENFGFSSNAPTYRTCDFGINFLGECANKSCKAFGKQVICPMGYGDFDLMYKSTRCPSCNNLFDAKTCGFLRTWWKYCGEKTDGTNVNKDWTLAGMDNEIAMFVPNALKKHDPVNIKKFCAEWKVLKFQVRDPKKCPTNMKNERLDPDKAFCPICIENIEVFVNLQVTNCLHFFHKECIQEWVLSQKGKIATCPNCRKEIGDIKIGKKIRLKSEKHFKKYNPRSFGFDDPTKKHMLMNHIKTKNGQCTVLNGGQKLTFQHWFYCETCDIKGNHGICETCKNVCHKDHVTRLSKDSPSFFRCCCGNGECKDGCKCMNALKQPVVTNGPLVVGLNLPCGKELLDDAIKAGCCTFNVTGRNYIRQEAWSCEDCGLKGGYLMCVVCKDKCHKGHKIQRVYESKSSFCDCGCGMGRVPCKCMSRENKRKRDENKDEQDSSKKRKIVK